MAEARIDARQQQALLVLVILIGLNLRPFLTAIGPLSRDIAEALGLGMDTLAWLTLLPLWLIGGGVLLTPALRSRTGPRQLLGRPCCCWAWGAMRFEAGSGALLIASAALCGLGSALVRGVLPGLIKQAFAQKVPLVMGIFSACMMGAGRWVPASPRSSPPGSTGPRRWRCGACRCCWPWAGSAGGYGCPLRRWQCPAAASSASSACPAAGC